MAYQLIPQNAHIIVVPLKPSETKQYTGKLLNDVETSGMDVLQYGRVIKLPLIKSWDNKNPVFDYQVGDIVAYPKLASDKTNFGEPRQVIVEVQHIKAYVQDIGK